jgi:hypothetical protein
MLSLLNFPEISLKYPDLETKVHCENIQHVPDFLLLKTVLLRLASCKHEPRRFLLTANETCSQTGAADTVPTFPHISPQKV